MRILFYTFVLYILQIPIESIELPVYPHDKAELDSSYWNRVSENALRDALNQKLFHKKAKNVVIFLGDGMGITTITSARILKGQLVNKSGEESVLSFDKFPNLSLIKTYNVDYQVPDSAGTATAYLCGVKTNLGVLGVNAHVLRSEKNCDIVENNSVTSILQWAIDSGKSAGIVTTTRITHATPGAGYANIADRYWEAYMPFNDTGNCKDIARQLVEDEPGSKLKVILGGGRRNFLPDSMNASDNEYGYRRDGKNLIQQWLNSKNEQNVNNKYVDTKEKLYQINYDQIEYLFGLFNANHLSYDMERDRSPTGEPSLEEMTESAIKVLSKDPNGFVLLVEGGRIDHAHHDNYAVHSLYETIAFDNAIAKAVSMLPQSETLMVVTADHSHTLTINGEPKRGNSIFGVTRDDDEPDSKPYTTLMYGNGPGYEVNKTDPTTVNTAELRYQQLSATHLIESNHGGEDVAVYSVGPMSHLFVGTQEQSYIAHVMAFAACIGRYSNEDHCVSPLNSSSEPIIKSYSLFTILCLQMFSIIICSKFNRHLF